MSNDDDREAIASGPTRIGAYEIKGILGSGGMGTVYLAEQMEPVQRPVALKVLQSGRGSQSGIARMLAEKQALALMSHPSIATVYDAGTTEIGLPYFAMEVVDGSPILEFCDEKQLGIIDRLQLFLQVCDAVQHAHQKMVIHRDLKPSNVLVTLKDGRPMPKLIDFGIAKCLEQPLIKNEPLVTREGLPVGTPQYMSPEQVESHDRGIDARVDVYALGILLFEVLAGAPPLDIGESDALQQMMRVLKVDYPRPSVRFDSFDDNTRASIAAMRNETSSSLMKILKSDLEWIIMKTIEKDRDRRYDSAAELRADIQRYLASQPVIARAPSMGYRLRRFVERYRLAVSSGLIVVLALTAGLTVSTISLVRTKRARDNAQLAQARSDATVAYLRKVLASVDPGVDGRQIRVVDVLANASKIVAADLADQPEVEASVRTTIGLALLELGLFEDAGAELTRAVEIQRRVLGLHSFETLHTENAVGRQLYKVGRFQDAAEIHESVLQRQAVLLGEEDPAFLWTMYNLAKDLGKNGDWKRAEETYQKNLMIRRRVLGDKHLDTLISANGFAIFLARSGRPQEALEILEGNRRHLEQVVGADHPDTLRAGINFVEALNIASRYEEAEELGREILNRSSQILGATHPETLGLKAQLAIAAQAMGASEEAQAILKRVVQLRREKLGEFHPDTLETTIDYGLIMLTNGQIEAGSAEVEYGLREAREHLPRDSWRTASFEARVGAFFLDTGRYEEAEKLLLSSHRTLINRKHPEAEVVARDLKRLEHNRE